MTNPSTRLEHATHLVDAADESLSGIRAEYERSLADKEVSVRLRIMIKGVLDQLRSSLDFGARALMETANCEADRIFFPISGVDQGEGQFPALLGRTMRGIEVARPEIAQYLKSIQFFSRLENYWLPALASLAAENKHEQLSPQTRSQARRVEVTNAQGGSVDWAPDSVVFGAGVSILGAPVDPATQLPVSTPGNTVTERIWVSFTFDETGHPVLQLLADATAGSRTVVNGIRQFVA